MGLVCKFDGATGNITLLGPVDGVHLAELDVEVNDHDHPISGKVGNHNENLPCQSVTSDTSFHTAANSGGGGDTWEGAHGIGGGVGDSRDHAHGVGALHTTQTLTSTGLSPKNDNQILIDSSIGHLICDLIDGVAPEVTYDEYDGNYHYCYGNLASETLPSIYCKGNGGNLYFHVSANADGSGAIWARAHIKQGAHPHGSGNIALAAYNAPAGAGVDDPGEPKLRIDHLTGSLSLKGNVNGIGIKEFKADYDAHPHKGTGTSASFGPSYAQMFGPANQVYFEVGAPGNWEECNVVSAAHGHPGAGITVGAPT